MIKKIILNHHFMGMSYRNNVLISNLNSDKSIELVDNKVLYKKLLELNNIRTPKLLKVIESIVDYPDIKNIKPPFAIKPVNGHGGQGILIIIGKTEDKFIDISNKEWSDFELKRHLMLIFDGAFSLGNQFDSVLIEEMINIPKKIRSIFPLGVPDIRVILYKNTPILSMVRVPTQKSNGKANLSQGADALHVDISNGKVMGYYSSEKKKHIDLPIEYNITLPDWKEIIQIAIIGTEVSGLGYCGIDIVYDENGPMILECNARPGLEIQNVTKTNLRNLLIEKKSEENEFMLKTVVEPVSNEASA